MGSYNRCVLVGHLGRDAEMKQTGGGTVANVTLATTTRFKGKDGSMQEDTQWHRIVVWNKLADDVGKYLTKGKEILVEGQLRTRSYEKDGEKKFVTEIRADRVVLLGKGDGSTGRGRGRDAGDEYDDDSAPKKAIQVVSADDDDDIPF